jgi:hypothetical protein
VAEELAIDLFELAQRTEVVVVIKLDVAEHGDLDGKREQRAVRLVGLDDQPFATAPVAVASRLAQYAADQVARLEPAAAQRADDHARRRGLAVRAGNGDRAPQRGQLGEQIGARSHDQSACSRRYTLHVVAVNRARVDDLHVLALRDVPRAVSKTELEHTVVGERPRKRRVGLV